MSISTANNKISIVINRLGLIRSLLLLEELDGIDEQIIKLRQLDVNGVTEKIIAHLDHKSYAKAIEAIDTFLRSNQQLMSYVDPKVSALRLEAQVLATEFQQLSDEKMELERIIAEFAARHNKELGALILKILRRRKERAKGTSEEKAAESEYNAFSKEYETEKDKPITELTENELEELKFSYRKASKLCHPDVVSDEYKEMAEKIFLELNAAYERNDLQRVKSILDQLEKGSFFVSKSATLKETQLLEIEIERLRLLIQEAMQQLETIRESEAYKTIRDIDDWDAYFSRTRLILEKEASEFQDNRT